MKERPIIMTAESVRAILEGRKTQTRRVVKSQPPETHKRFCWFSAPVMGWTDQPTPAQDWHKVKSPFGPPYGRLWVKETFAARVDIPSSEPARMRHYAMYRADGCGDPRDPMNYHEYTPWTSPLFMPRQLSRITLADLAR